MPTKKNNRKTVLRIVEFVRIDGSEREACEYVNVPRRTYQGRKKK